MNARNPIIRNIHFTFIENYNTLLSRNILIRLFKIRKIQILTFYTYNKIRMKLLLYILRFYDQYQMNDLEFFEVMCKIKFYKYVDLRVT